MIWQKATLWSKKHVRLLAYTSSASFIALWTTLRFFTQKTIFDLVGQQVLAQQLLHGGIAGAGIGITNYIPKLLFLYIPLHLLPGSPRIKLLLLTVAVNIATIVLLGLVLEKVLRKFGVKAGALLWIGLLWLAMIAGSVFWVQFTNSRNLEVVGGIFLLYQGICYMEQPSWRRLIAIGLFATVLFFADTLQLYMIAMPLVLYGITLAFRTHNFRSISLLAGGFIVAYLGSKLLFASCVELFSIHFLQNGGGNTAFSAHNLLHGVIGSLKAFVHLYSGAADAGKLRELCNLGFLMVIASLCVYSAWHKLLPKRLLLLCSYILVTNGLIYIASGQAQSPDTERYLIMTAPILVLLLAGLQASWKSFKTAGSVVVAIVVTVNALYLASALVTASKHRFSQDDHLASVTRFMRHSPTLLSYASMDTAIPMSYLYGSDTVAPLPLSCNGSQLQKNTTFYSKTAYTRREGNTHTMIALILDGSGITNTPSTCNQISIINQLGEPTAITTSDDGSMILLFNPRVSQKLHY